MWQIALSLAATDVRDADRDPELWVVADDEGFRPAATPLPISNELATGDDKLGSEKKVLIAVRGFFTTRP